MKIAKLFLVAIAAAFLTSPVLQAQREKLPPDDLEFVQKTYPEAKKTPTGIRYIIMKEGTGIMPKAGDKVAVLYVLKLLNGTKLDEANDPKNPFSFRVRRDMVIEGWDQVLPLMKVGERRMVIIPPELAYGTRGQPPKIGRNATLIFEIELISCSKE